MNRYLAMVLLSAFVYHTDTGLGADQTPKEWADRKAKKLLEVKTPARPRVFITDRNNAPYLSVGYTCAGEQSRRFRLQDGTNEWFGFSISLCEDNQNFIGSIESIISAENEVRDELSHLIDDTKVLWDRTESLAGRATDLESKAEAPLTQDQANLLIAKLTALENRVTELEQAKAKKQ